ncbi:hypothetical protein J1N35_008297 [Gossypium stocksii]|uniref:Aminotransferase-like plant mobile domain-containing protein n=1 Tax=Gossypium stocksii TaxID=47602 RepID=A0A9D3W7X0_9ROSI|nr:hypothetical protein J1N35_008297 [Gossypium stocksii]
MIAEEEGEGDGREDDDSRKKGRGEGDEDNVSGGQLPYCVLRGSVNGVGYLLDERIMPYLKASRFRSVALILMFDLKYNLISALVERWGLETQTFHFSRWECTINLEDVALQLGLPIDSFTVTGLSTLSNQETICYDLLERSHDNAAHVVLGLHHAIMKYTVSRCWGKFSVA